MKVKKIIMSISITLMLAMLGFVADVFAAKPEDYDVYSSDYVYQRLGENEKKLFDDLKAVCGKYMTEALDVTSESGYIIDYVSYEGIATKDIHDLIQVFGFQNPQYFFLSNSYSIKGDKVALTVIPQFAKGTDRLDARDKMFAGIDAIVAGVSGTDYEKEKALHDIVCKNVIYHTNQLDQSAYSAWNNRESVCAGYSKYFALLLNKAGIESVIVSSSDHAWNKVKLGDKWYVADVTWDDTTYDQYDAIVYFYFNKSDAYIEAEDGTEGLIGGHQAISIYAGKAPVCGENYTVTATVPLITKVMIAPSGTEGFATAACTLEEGGYIGLKYSLSKTFGDTTCDERLSFEYSENGIAEVEEVITESGRYGYKVKGVKAGTVAVTAVSANGIKSDPLTVTVTKTTKFEEETLTSTDEMQASDDTKEDSDLEDADDIDFEEEEDEEDEEYEEEEKLKIKVSSVSFKKVSSKVKKKLVMNWKKSKDATGYEIWLSYSKNFKKGLKKYTVKKQKTTSKTIKKLKSKKKCFVKIRAYRIVDGTKYYSSWSKVKGVKIK